MRKIINPFNSEQNHCFGCSKSNPFGLKLEFFESEEAVHADWMPDTNFQGYPNVLHGGLIATLLDEIGVWCIYVKAGTSGVTSTLKTRYLSPVYISKGPLKLSARLISTDKTKAIIYCSIHDSESKLCAEAEAEYFIYPPELARKRMKYPGKEAFYESE
jgi:uncharacterized protein (TIGR00369 family)